MGSDCRSLVVVRAAHANLGRSDSSEEMPFVLVELTACIPEARAPAQNNWTEIGNVETEFFDQFPSGGFFGGLTGLDAATRRIPIRTSVGIRVKEEQQPVLFIKEKHAGNLAHGRRRRLHRIRSLVAAGVGVNRGRRNTHSARQEQIAWKFGAGQFGSAARIWAIASETVWAVNVGRKRDSFHSPPRAIQTLRALMFTAPAMSASGRSPDDPGTVERCVAPDGQGLKDLSLWLGEPHLTGGAPPVDESVDARSDDLV